MADLRIIRRSYGREGGQTKGLYGRGWRLQDQTAGGGRGQTSGSDGREGGQTKGLYGREGWQT